MKGFNIDKDGNVLSVAVDWEPSYIDQEGRESKVKQPENTVYTEDFDKILAKMTAPAEVRENPVFAADGSYKMVKDESPEVLAYLAKMEKMKKLGIA